MLLLSNAGWSRNLRHDTVQWIGSIVREARNRAHRDGISCATLLPIYLSFGVHSIFPLSFCYVLSLLSVFDSGNTQIQNQNQKQEDADVLNMDFEALR